MSELSKHIENLKPRMAEIRRYQSQMSALMQQMSTTLAIATADDWEDRYVAEGIRDIEDAANA